jgi:hypothetical protein
MGAVGSLSASRVCPPRQAGHGQRRPPNPCPPGPPGRRRPLRSARPEVIRARACLPIWAGHDGELRQQIRSTAVAAERAKDALDEVLTQFPPT